MGLLEEPFCAFTSVNSEWYPKDLQVIAVLPVDQSRRCLGRRSAKGHLRAAIFVVRLVKDVAFLRYVAPSTSFY